MGQSILIVDDSATLRQQLSGLLTAEGFDVVTVPNATTGLAAVKGRSFDLLIVDVNMPGMNGIDMVAEIRTIGGYEKTPIFILTAESTDHAVKAGKEAGATAWMIKPFKPDVLLNGVKRMLGLD